MWHNVNVGAKAHVATATQVKGKVKILPGNTPMATNKLTEHVVPIHRLRSVDVGT
jgi:hypothetical protein